MSVEEKTDEIVARPECQGVLSSWIAPSLHSCGAIPIPFESSPAELGFQILRYIVVAAPQSHSMVLCPDRSGHQIKRTRYTLDRALATTQIVLVTM